MSNRVVFLVGKDLTTNASEASIFDSILTIVFDALVLPRLIDLIIERQQHASDCQSAAFGYRMFF